MAVSGTNPGVAQSAIPRPCSPAAMGERRRVEAALVDHANAWELEAARILGRVAWTPPRPPLAQGMSVGAFANAISIVEIFTGLEVAEEDMVLAGFATLAGGIVLAIWTALRAGDYEDARARFEARRRALLEQLRALGGAEP